MRLICGLLMLDGSAASETLLRRMADQMDVPRLKPALSIHVQGSIGLAVMDFSGPVKPLPVLNGRVMAADVRLDVPASPSGKSGREEDAQLLAALEQQGPLGLGAVMGDFAFAAAAAGGTLVCGRDIFGVRPFSYVHRPGEIFAFASMPNALHGAGVITRKMDMDAHARRMVRILRFDDSLVQGVKRLPPAHILEVSREGLKLKRYWQMDRAKVGTSRLAPQEAAAQMRQRVEEAVRCRLPRGAGIGAHLSGGLDSSAIAVLAARALREEDRALHSYSFLDRQRNDVQLEDETAFVQAVRDQEPDMDWTAVRPPTPNPDNNNKIPSDPDGMVSFNPDSPENIVAAAAERQKVGLVLSGWGGDEAATFNGRGALAELFKRGRWGTLGREVAALAKERGWTKGEIFYREVLFYLREDMLPAGLVQFARRLAGKKDEHQQLFRSTLSARTRKMLDALPDTGAVMVGDGRENRWRLITGPHIAHRLEKWALTGARHGIAYAFPLLDRRVVELALSLPSEYFLSGGFRRRLFRDAMAGVLPDKVRRRHEKYTPFPGGVLNMADNGDRLRERIASLENDEQVRAVLDLDRMKELMAQFPAYEDVREEMLRGEAPEKRGLMSSIGQALGAAGFIQEHGGGKEDA